MPGSPNQKAAAFVALHERPGAFVLPNPWDVGSARMFEALRFDALATTSSGFAQTLGRSDGMVTLDEKLQHCRELAQATSIPITADLENGFGDDPESVAACIRRAAETGLVGGSIEDFTGNRDKPIYDLNLAVERIAAAVEAAGSCSFKFTLTARAEILLRGGTDIDEAILRLQAYEAAGADVLYAPGLKSLEEVRMVADSVNKPLNVLGPFVSGHSVDAIGEAGAKRVSTGGGLARLVARVVIDTATRLQEHGDLTWVANAAPGAEIARLFSSRSKLKDPPA